MWMWDKGRVCVKTKCKKERWKERERQRVCVCLSDLKREIFSILITITIRRDMTIRLRLDSATSPWKRLMLHFINFNQIWSPCLHTHTHIFSARETQNNYLYKDSRTTWTSLAEKTLGITALVYAERFTDLDKLNLVKIYNGSKVLGSSQFLILPQLPQKTTLASKVVEIDSKIIISLC